MADTPLQQVHTQFFSAILDHAATIMEREDLLRLMASVGTDETTLRQRDGWISLELTERLVEALVEASGDPDFMVKCSRRLVVGSYLGPFKILLGTLGTPGEMLKGFPKTSPRWSKWGTWTVHEVDDEAGFARMSFRSEVERSRHICVGRWAQTKWAFPGIFGLEPATVVHDECMHDGADRCVYEFQWTPATRGRWRIRVAVALGGGVFGLILGMGLQVGALATAAFASVMAALFAALLVLSDNRQALKRSDELLFEQDLELRQTLKRNEQRVRELEESKASVDAKVERQTRSLAHALEEVKRLDQVKTTFFANVNHELRTPLQLILAPLEDLVAGHEPAGGRTAAFLAMQRSAKRLHHLIDEVLDLARADAGAERLRRTAVNLPELVHNLVAQFSVRAEHAGVHLVADLEPEEQSAMLDSHWIEGALTNLIANAIRHCDPGDHVTLRARWPGGRLVFEVADTGPGIPAADLPNIFDRFAQSVQKEGAHRGSGLGLAFVEQAAQLHDGTASVESTEGQGATFRLDLPLVAATPAPVARTGAPRPVLDVVQAVPEWEFQALAPVFELEGPPDAPLVVIADDEPDLRTYIAQVLSEQYRVVACANGQIALQEALKRLPDLVVTDMSMPEMTGRELCQALRSEATTAHIPVILLTAHQALNTKLEVYEAGASDYLIKPFHAKELLARAKTHVTLQQVQRALSARERLAATGRMAGEICHLLANPLNVILNGLPELRSGLPEDDIPLADVLVDCGRRMQLVTDNLRTLADDRHRSPTTRYRVVEQVRTAIRLAEASNPTTIEFRSSLEGDPIIEVREGELDQALQHLLDYAIAAAAPTGTVDVQCYARNDRAHILIAHSGPRASNAERVELLRAFVSADAGASVAIAANLIQSQGGRLAMDDSEVWSGDQFDITFPLVVMGQASPSKA